MTEREIIILIGHGSPEKDSGDLEYIAEHVHGMIHPECENECVRVAYLQFMKPDVMTAIRKAVKSGAKKIIVHPYFLSSGYHVTKNIPDLIRIAKDHFPDVDFICTDPLGAHEKLAEVVLERIKSVTH